MSQIRIFFLSRVTKIQEKQNFGGQVKSPPMDPLVFIIFRNNLNGYGDFKYHGAYVGAASPKAGESVISSV
jgi:hypothetical protein